MSLKISNPNFVKEVLKTEKLMINDAKEDIAFAVITGLSNVITQTYPHVDTGRYIASHVIEKGTRGNEVAPDGKSKAANESKADQNLQKANQFKFDFKTNTYYIANNLEYASHVEARWKAVYGIARKKTEKAINQRIAERNRKVYK